MNNRIVSVFVLAILAGTACSQKGDAPAPAGPGAKPQDASPPAVKVNIAAADMGGAVEELTGNYGPGFTGRRLIDGLLDPSWRWAEDYKEVPYPQEAIISFFERQPAVIRALTFVLSENASAAPKDIEIWTSMSNPYENFSRVATATLEAKSGEQTVDFDPVEAKFVKLRVLSGIAPQSLEIAEVRVIEAARPGYTPLFVRAPTVKFWKGSPREAAQRGLDWLQHAAPTWAKKNNCFGCHVQGQVLMGQAIALEQGYRMNMSSVRALDEKTRYENSWGQWFGSDSASVFGAMGVAYAADILGIKSDKGLPGAHPYSEGLLLVSADHLLSLQAKDGALPVDFPEPPIVQGQFMTTANALVSIGRAAAHSADPKYKLAAERAVAWIATHDPQTTQDRIFKIIALMHYGTPDQKRAAWSVVESLAAEQQPDGG